MQTFKTTFVKVTIKNMTQTMLLLCSFAMVLLSPQALANESTSETTNEPLVRGIVFTNTETTAAAVTTSAYQNEIEAWYEANLFQNNAPVSPINVTTTSQKTSNGNKCLLTRSIVMLSNSGEGSAIASSQVNISEHCPQ